MELHAACALEATNNEDHDASYPEQASGPKNHVPASGGQKVTNVTNRFTILSDDKCQCGAAGAGINTHITEGQGDARRYMTTNGKVLATA